MIRHRLTRRNAHAFWDGNRRDNKTQTARFLNSRRPSHQSWVLAKDRELLDRTSSFQRAGTRRLTHLEAKISKLLLALTGFEGREELARLDTHRLARVTKFF